MNLYEFRNRDTTVSLFKVSVMQLKMYEGKDFLAQLRAFSSAELMSSVVVWRPSVRLSICPSVRVRIGTRHSRQYCITDEQYMSRYTYPARGIGSWLK